MLFLSGVKFGEEFCVKNSVVYKNLFLWVFFMDGVIGRLFYYFCCFCVFVVWLCIFIVLFFKYEVNVGCCIEVW